MQTRLCEEYCKQSFERDEILINWKVMSVMTYVASEFSRKEKYP